MDGSVANRLKHQPIPDILVHVSRTGGRVHAFEFNAGRASPESPQGIYNGRVVLDLSRDKKGHGRCFDKTGVLPGIPYKPPVDDRPQSGQASGYAGIEKRRRFSRL